MGPKGLNRWLPWKLNTGFLTQLCSSVAAGVKAANIICLTWYRASERMTGFGLALTCTLIVIIILWQHQACTGVEGAIGGWTNLARFPPATTNCRWWLPQRGYYRPPLPS